MICCSKLFKSHYCEKKYIYQDSVDVKRQMYIVKIHKHKKDDQYVKFVSRGRCEPNLSGT